ncbi:MAG TPA: PA2779 family protein [Ramlibacter sp.]|nr:PA2779 family protein [Ramlibacter sp.]
MRKSIPLTRGLVAMIAASMVASTSLVHADMIGVEAVSAPTQAEQDRAKVQDFVDRATVKERLQAMGVSGLLAKDRVASLTEEEVHALAQRIDSMPAGGALSSNDLILILLIAVLVALVL